MDVLKLVQKGFEVLWEGGLGNAVIVTVLAWLLVEFVFSDLPSKWWKRLFSVLLGVAMVTLGHSSGVTDFGPGPDGMLRAAFFGLCAGGLAPLLHQAVVARWLPFLKRKRDA